jgi:hypothetical protein
MYLYIPDFLNSIAKSSFIFLPACDAPAGALRVKAPALRRLRRALAF